ncbi:unnamed protein product [Arctia plantaginis]|uniref:Dipeptidylpeptidase IV N-terminal domain-containing protein n=1 Tax=Arctia plantaginis TaxID=874455 RepID=A0A8S1BAU0_ARCPL|nr:unnamed protein product [Arctia plantaginis]
MEMGTSDQVLVATKRKKTLTYAIGIAAMLAIIAVIVTLVVVLTGGDSAAVDPIITTEGPTSPDIPTSEAQTTSPIAVETTTEAVLSPIDLEEIIEGAFATPSFNATWASGNEAIFRNAFGDLILFNVDTSATQTLVQNSSQILQRSSRVAALSPDRTVVVLAHDVVPVYRYSFLARYSLIDVEDGNQTDILPTNVDYEQGFLQNFVWGPSGTALAFVYLNNIYYQGSMNEEPRQITTSGVLHVIYNGIPDWVYEEEVFGSNNAIWFSNDGNKLAYATFNDTDVRIMKVPHYGVPGSLNYQYTQHHDIRYPKTGTTNPTVSVTLFNLLTNENNVYEAPTDLNEPILKSVRFVNNDNIAVMWTDRVQTRLSVVICTSGVPTCSQIYTYSETNGWIDNVPLIFNEAGNSFITILPQVRIQTQIKVYRIVVAASE